MSAEPIDLGSAPTVPAPPGCAVDALGRPVPQAWSLRPGRHPLLPASAAAV